LPRQKELSSKQSAVLTGLNEGEWFHEFITFVGQSVTAFRVSATEESEPVG